MPCLLLNRVHTCFEPVNRVELCEAAVASASADVSARLALCQAYFRVEDYDKAEAVLQNGIVACPMTRRSCRPLHLALSNLREQRRTQSNSGSDTEESVMVQRSYCLGPLANDRSIEACKNLAANNDKDINVWLTLANKLMSTGRTGDAMQVLSDKPMRDSKDERVVTARAQAEKQLGQIQSSCLQDSLLEKCKMLLEWGPQVDDRIALKLLELLLAAGNDLSAIQSLEDYPLKQPLSRQAAQLIASIPISKDPGPPTVLRLRADAYRFIGERDKEKKILETLLIADRADEATRKRLDQLNKATPVKPDFSPGDTVAEIPAKNTPATAVLNREQETASVATAEPVLETPPIRDRVSPEVTQPRKGASTTSERPATDDQLSEQQPLVMPAKVYSNSLIAGGRAY